MSARKSGYEGFGERIRLSLQRKADELGAQGTPGKRKPKYGISFEEFAKNIGVKIESARLYAMGAQFPGDAKVLERMASYLGVSVGYLITGEESGASQSPPPAPSSAVTAPVTRETLIEIQDDAMLVQANGLRLLGKGDSAILAPIRPRSGDIVAVRQGDKVTLRILVEDGATDRYEAANPGHPAVRTPLVLGVVTEAKASLGRLS